MREYIDYINYIKNNHLSKEDAIKLLKEDENLTRDDKNLVIAYCFPRQLLDRELPSRIKDSWHKSGYSGLNVSPSDVTLILEASQTEQYRRYIKHLMYSFSEIPKIHPVLVDGHEENARCGICDCEILYSDDWNKFFKDNDPEMEHLAFGSTESGITLCKHCLIQLVSAMEKINDIDPGYLDWMKRYDKAI